MKFMETVHKADINFGGRLPRVGEGVCSVIFVMG